MQYWKKLQSYVTDFEKSIDDGFAKRNQQEAAHDEDKTIIISNISDNEIILDQEQEESKIKSKEINENKPENQENSNSNEKLDVSNNNENAEQNQSQEEFNDLNNENQEEENEEKIQQRISELKQKIKTTEDELESKNKLFEKLQNIKEKMGPDSESLVLEFETRNSKMNNQIKELKDIEEKIKKEIEELNSNLNSLFLSSSIFESENPNNESNESFDHEQIQAQLQKDYSNIQKELSQAQDEYKKIIESSKNLINEDQQLTIDIDSTTDLITKNKNRILQLKKEREDMDINITKIQDEIEAEKLVNIRLSTENATSESDLQHIKNEQNTYNEKINAIKKNVVIKFHDLY